MTEIIGQRSPITIFLVQLFRDAPEASIVSFAQISDAAQLPKHQCYPYIQSALRIVESEYGRVFANIRNVGYEHLPDGKVSKYANTKHVQKLKNNAKQFRRKLETVDTAKLNPGERVEYTMANLNAHLMETTTAPKTQKRIQSKASANPMESFPIDRFLEAFGGQ